MSSPHCGGVWGGDHGDNLTSSYEDFRVSMFRLCQLDLNIEG